MFEVGVYALSRGCSVGIPHLLVFTWNTKYACLFFEASLQLLLQLLSVRYLVALYFTVEARSNKISFF